MPPLVLEIGVAIALVSALVKTTTTINRIENNQRLGHIELIGKHEVLKTKLEIIEKESCELRQDIKDLRRRRSTDPDTGFN
ncbi:hypothetical protein H6F42_15905 [Pseudanabaena sp. FACHB-1998]|uniref:hypothetical protein n=1 Tax=Pseudanabaena sp. FACHB-1998 TaxID=2692858 RepID=UPI0016813FFD|nr:hypothetical protein [Pseudanabaena sp. FACHB-1998]MBD2178404.1 hypothetical protein [Pseudanabaena sp. FACHB-1998]